MTALPAAHVVMSQSCVPATPTFGHERVHVAPEGQIAWQGPDAQVKWHSLPAAQVHVPLAHVPSQRWLSPWQFTWQGGAPHVKAQLAPGWQGQSY